MRPAGRNLDIAFVSIVAMAPNSSFTAMRSPWKLRLAGCCFSRKAAAGIALRITETNCAVVLSSSRSLARQMAEAMAAA